MNLCNQARPARRAMTLTELLVVVAIVVILASILLPMVQPVLRGQKVREASRQVSVMLTAAQAKAVATGRPAGVWIERAAHEPTSAGTGDPRWYTSFRLYPAEQPLPYRGDLLDARVVVRPPPGIAVTDQWAAWFADPLWPDPTRPQVPCCSLAYAQLTNGIPIVRPGDLIRFEGRGKYYLITSVEADKFTFRAPPVLISGVPQNDPDIARMVKLPPTPDQLASYQPGVPFEILRRPVKATGAPVQLPTNTAIDLSVSGYSHPFQAPLEAYGYYADLTRAQVPLQAGAARFREVNPEYDIVVMFSPDGGLDRVWYVSHEERALANLNQITPDDLVPFWEIPHGDLNLLVARDDQIGLNVNLDANFVMNIASPLGSESLRDTANQWIQFTSDSGRVISGPNADAFTNDFGQPVAAATLPELLSSARRLLNTGRSVGGQ